MFECPNCGRNLKFDISLQTMHCEYCETTLDPYSVEEKNRVKETEEVNGEVTETGELMRVTVYTCPQCGGEIVGDENEAMVFCSYCGASTPLNGKMRDLRRPEVIVPFTKTKDDCFKAYKKLVGRALFAPKEVKECAKPDSFRGIYMPYWIYDFSKKGPIYYEGTHKYQKGDYLYTDHMRVESSIEESYKGVTYDASSSFDDSLSQSIAPYDVSQRWPFTTAFMSGFYADVYDVEAGTYEKMAKDVVAYHAAAVVSNAQKTSKYQIDMKSLTNTVRPNTDRQTLSMMPVWFMSMRYRQKKGEDRMLYAVVNGQTGTAAADLPVSVSKFFVGSLILAIPLFLIIYGLFTITPRALVYLCLAILLATLIALWSQSTKIDAWENGDDDLGKKQIDQSRGRKVKKKSKAFKESWKKVKLPFWIAFFISSFLVIFNPFRDMLQYTGAVFTGVVDIYMLMTLVNRYNAMTSRPLPQFNRKGGDDSAEIKEQ